ncbi:site-specific DNA-methyltransferase [Neptunomonas phycophila]|uniref:site-specific DNA-methyltransferase (adenine-specific) n=1 Tax=Neptunomonas phycophila TaxID=1572645 RepID=A0ABT9EY26_9GAMM|nr:site-specific DNA-methyltransferase [Neptunomonas phycophila]MDP2523955.1 site-specific DNA-methyltransferase [Neptunomonas phycophila]
MKKVELEDGQSADIVSENTSKLKELFPDAFSEGAVNFDTLRQLLGDASVLDEGEEKFGLNWHGKKKARQIALTPSTGTLLPCPEESLDWENTQNLFIEGDNLEVLKLLQKSYANRIGMIYIDPPYNTGHELIYPDKYQENLDTYLKYTNQVDEEGFKLTSNSETTGRKHTNWLSMMLPRLKLAKSLLNHNGILFVSIDDGEVANLRSMLDELFGEENFIGLFVWKSRVSEDTRAKTGLSSDHEYILCYRKDIGVALRGAEKDLAKFKNPDNDSRGAWRSADITGLATKDKRPNLHYDLINPETEINYGCPPKGWRFDKGSMERRIQEGRILWPTSEEGRPRQKLFLEEMDSIYKNISSVIQSVSTSDGTREINSLLGDGVFDFPKPSKLLELLVEQVSDPDAIILDFFAGSCSMANAVMKVNAKQSANRRFIMVQLPEYCDPKSAAHSSGYKTISEIGRARIEKSGEQIIEAAGGDGIDAGFKLFKLSSSNIQAWNPDRTDLEESLLSHEEHLVEGRTEQDVLYELLLKRGVDLTVPIESREVSGKNIYSIGYGVLFACLDESITKDQVENIAQAIIAWYGELAPSSDTHVFFRDSAFRDDVSKTNMAAILEQNGITHVRSL